MYVPISHDNIITSKFQRNAAVQHHKVLQICSDYNFCLHSKERVPFHVVIEVEAEGQGPLESSNSEEDPHSEVEPQKKKVRSTGDKRLG